jgi:hypothetical protein
MHPTYRTWWVIVAIMASLPIGWRILTWPGFRPAPIDPGMAKAGDELFHHDWKPGDSLSPEGDGLGPVFNERSCVACHNQGSSGGGGSLANNVTTFSVRVGGQKPREGVVHAFAIEGFQETLHDVHPKLPAIVRPKLSQLVPDKRGEGGPLIPMPAGVVVSQVPT